MTKPYIFNQAKSNIYDIYVTSSFVISISSPHLQRVWFLPVRTEDRPPVFELPFRAEQSPPDTPYAASEGYESAPHETIPTSKNTKS